MILVAVSYLGGVLTILSPCILPVLPFVFARASGSFLRGGLPLLAGMVLTFAAVASLATAGGWAVQVNEYGRLAALVLFAVFGLALLLPRLANWLARPFVAAGARLAAAGETPSSSSPSSPPSPGASLLLGAATGLLWAPCAGPILGLILTGAALHGASFETAMLLLAYAAGAATSLAAALLVGGRALAAMKRSLGAGEWIRRGLGAAVLAAVAAITLGLDTGFLARLSTASTTRVEQALIDRIAPQHAADAPAPGPASAAADGEEPLWLSGAVDWLNSPALTPRGLRGKVVLIDFWTYSCINCLRSIPYVRAWHEKYKDEGLVVIGVHTPEFAFEKNIANVRKAARDLGIDYPIAIDNDYAIWRAFNNQYWPAHYFIDAEGRVRHFHFGEGAYDQSEQVIRQLLAETGRDTVASDLVSVDASGAQAAADMDNVKSHETYLGYARTENFASPGGVVRNKPQVYAAAPAMQLNQWALEGDWTIEDERSVLNAAGGRITFRFHARDLHLVLASPAPGQRVRFRVLIDGRPPGADRGGDIDEEGYGAIDDQRLYQLIRQNPPVAERTFQIEFLDPGAQAFAFTFG